MTKIFLIAGEESGDIHGANMIRQLKELTDFSLYGTGGNRLKDLGQIQYFDISQMTIIGINEVIEKITLIYKMFRILKDKLLEIDPDLVILVDYPGFNLRFAEYAKSKGFKVLYYIAPQIWAWHYSRIVKIKKNIDYLYCILPFEEELFRKEGVNAKYVGNPIIDNIRLKFNNREEFCSSLGVKPDKRIIGLLPGSREKEIKNILPIFKTTVSMVEGEFVFVLACADSIMDEMLGLLGEKIMVVRGITYDVMKYSDIVWCCSGTATLESTFLGTPPIIVYKVPFFTELVGRYIIRLKRIGLPNIVLDRNIFPELVNKDLNSTNLLKWTEYILMNREEFDDELKKIQQLFSNRNPSKIVAHHIREHFLK